MKNEETRPGAPPVDGPAEAAQAQDGVPAAVSSTGPDVAKRYHMPGELIRDRFRVEEQIGQGAFGVIFGGVDTTTRNEVAIKCEWIEARRTVLRAEVLALKHLQSCPYVVRYITSGCHQNSVNYVIMERMGMNLVEARRHSKPPGDLDDAMVSTQLILHMLHAIHGIHNLGYVHRDIKPSNFVLRRSVTDLISSVNTEACYLIDFGLARRFRNEDGSLVPAREHTGFRGTTRYASMNSHLGRELGPVDDLWSLFYVYVEFIRGELPWRKRKEKDEILSLKQAHDESLAEGLPAEIGSFQQHLRTLSYPDTPNYELLEELLQTIHSNYKVAYQQQTEKQNIVNPLTPQTDYLKDPAAMGLSQTGQTNDTGHKSSGASHRKTPHSTGNDSQQAEDASKPKIHKSGSSSRLSIAGNSNIPTMSQSNRNSVVLQTNTTGKCVLETGKLTQKVHSTTARISPKNMHVRKSNPSNAKLDAMRVARPAAIAYHQDKNHSIVPENGGVNSPLLRETSFSGTFVGNELIAMTRTDTRVFECYGTVPNAVTMLPSEFFNPPIMSSISVADSLIAQRVREEQAVLPNDEASPRFLNNGTNVNNSARKAFSVQQCNMSEENGSEMNVQSAGSRSASKKREGNAVPEMNENNVLDNNKHRIATQQVIPSYHNNNKKRDHCSCCTIM